MLHMFGTCVSCLMSMRFSLQVLANFSVLSTASPIRISATELRGIRIDQLLVESWRDAFHEGGKQMHIRHILEFQVISNEKPITTISGISGFESIGMVEMCPFQLATNSHLWICFDFSGHWG